MTKARRGQPASFTSAQNEALRAALAEVHGRKNISQAKLGEILGCNQQNAGRLLKSAGFSYVSATRLVRFLGYAGVDTFFRAKNVLLPDEALASRGPNRTGTHG